MRPCLASLLSLCLAAPLLAAPPAFELKVDSGTLIRHAEPAALQPSKDRFGPGLDSVDLQGARGMRTQLLLPCRGIAEGDYSLGLLVLCGYYSAADEGLNGQVQLYLGGQRIGWTSHSEPLLPADAAEKGLYQTELLCEAPVHLKPADILRVAYVNDWGAVTLGPVRLYRTRPVHGIVKLDPPDWGRTQSYLLTAEWGKEEAAGGRVRQPLVLHNPSTVSRIFSVQTEARDYEQRSLLSSRDSVAVEAGKTVTRTIELTPQGERTRLTVTCAAPGMFPPVRLVKYYLHDRAAGPRPDTCLNGAWEMCWVPRAEVGDQPPAGAAWEKVSVPSSQTNDKFHCAWYRLAFDAPAHVQGDRYLLRFGQVLSEVSVKLNGQNAGYEKHGTQPFEVDVTAGFRPGQRNELLVGVRDWLAYSPVNRDRVARGEEPLFKDRMVDVAGYEAASHLGIGGSVWLEARPNVSVDDVFVVTSVRRKQLDLHYRLVNRSAADASVTLAPRVFDAGTFARAVPEKRLVVPAHKEATLDLEVPWPNARCWWPDDPHLYTLRTVLTPDGGPPDEHVQRFGFRELWIDGISFVLNGTRVKLRSAWAGGASGVYAAAGIVEPGPRLAAIWNWQTISREDRMVQVARTHNMGGVEEACDVADETGLILKIEDADVAQVSFTFDQTFWNNALRNEVRVVDTFKNHPSVCMWSAGNENMWGWIYQGEAAKTLGNRWQIKICKAMRAFDLQGRPIEWEADGDLMGGWEHHALHYPRELNQHPDLPVGAWWGALDGKTVVPYSMGPITLGEKPLTVGEAFWPANLNRPHGGSILLGDDAYLGGGAWGRAWMQSSQYFMNGFRDAEFALVDVYLPLWTLPAQTVVVKEETRSFVGGQAVRRTLNVHNDLFRPATLTLTWGVAGEKAIAGATQTLKLAPAELRRIDLAIPLPATKAVQRATFRVQLSEGPRRIQDQTQEWTIHPPSAAGAPTGKLAVFDPAGRTAALLKRLKVPFTALTELQAPDTPGLILGAGALKQMPPGPWREALGAYVRGGGKVLVLEQEESPDFLPVPLTLAAGRPTTLAFARATDHPALSGLTEADLRWWAGDHYVSQGNYRKPARGNAIPIVDVGTSDGLLETPLIEEFEGQGSYLLCQLELTGKALTAPPAGRILSNLLGYLTTPGAYRSGGATALFARPGSPLRKALDDSLLVYDDLTGKPGELNVEKEKVAIAEAALAVEEPLANALHAFAAAGGRVLIHRAAPEQQAALEALVGVKLRFFPMQSQPDDIKYRAIRRDNTGLMAGISNHELFWASNRMLVDLRHEGGWWSAYQSPKEEWIADVCVEPAVPQVTEIPILGTIPILGSLFHSSNGALTRPGMLVQVKVGNGLVVLNQFRFDEPLPELAVTAARLRALLLTNLGCTLRSEGAVAQARQRRLQQYEFFTVDLSPHCNRGLKEDKAAGIVGFTNQGENDMRALPTGRQTFAGVPFDIGAPKGAVVLFSTQANNSDLPKGVKGIRIGRKADELFFLHTSAWTTERAFRYQVNYDDGTSEGILIKDGQQVFDWWQDPVRYAEAMSRYGLFCAWQGENPMHKVALPGYEWVNPHPEKPIRDLDFLHVAENNFGTVPVLVAITGAVQRSSEGLVTDVIGTQGIKVRLGTEEQAVYYIGVAGIPADHAFYPQAVAAHRALVVGQKVTLQRDVVTEDADGHALAYVYLTPDTSNIRNLVNAKLIGDGLGKLGNFAGNDRHRMYIENLGFIAQQRKAGMWGQ